VNTLKYADDGFYYNNTGNPDWDKLMEYKESKTKGIKFNREKSREIKLKGK